MKTETKTWLQSLVQRQNSKAIEILKYVEQLENESATSRQAIELISSDDQYKCIAISTIHLNEHCKSALSALAAHTNMVFERDTGWFVKLYDELEYNLEMPNSACYELGEIPSQLATIYSAALSAGYRMIEFDSEAEAYNGFIKTESS